MAQPFSPLLFLDGEKVECTAVPLIMELGDGKIAESTTLEVKVRGCVYQIIDHDTREAMNMKTGQIVILRYKVDER
jgi:hypothetical protein